MAEEQPGICPNCEIRRGPVGEACPEPGCDRKACHFIPRDWYEAARSFATRRQKPLDALLGRYLDRYLLAGKIGEGGMGAVYLAIQKPLGREVALKVISGLELTQTTIARFEREARAISVLDHPNIVKLHDYGVGKLEFRVPYMALEYVRHGRTLRHALQRMRRETGGPIPGQVVTAIFGQVLHGLGAAHDLGIIHRDMKPDNVMIAPVRGNPYMVKLLDFGLAKAMAEVSGFDGEVSRTGQFLGTPYYMAPEQAPRRGRPKVDGRTDLYAVAVMLFEVFTGVRPFDGETALEVLIKKSDPAFRPMDLPEVRPLPRGLRAFLEKGLSASPEARFQSTGEMLDALGKAMSGRTPTAVGPLPAAHGSSQDQPATPPSPPPEPGGAGGLDPTQQIEEAAEVGFLNMRASPLVAEDALPSQDSRSTLDARPIRSGKWLVWVLGPVLGLATVGVLYLALSNGVKKTPLAAPEPANAIAPSVPDVSEAKLDASPSDTYVAAPDPSPAAEPSAPPSHESTEAQPATTTTPAAGENIESAPKTTKKAPVAPPKRHKRRPSTKPKKPDSAPGRGFKLL